MLDKPEKAATRAAERPVHCWANGPEETVGEWAGRLRTIGSTCMLPNGHRGPHQFTPNDRITVEFLR